MGGAEGGQEEADVCWEVVMDDVRPISDGAQPPHNHSSACEDIAASCARAGRPTAVVLHGDAHAVRGRRGGWRSTEPSIERYKPLPALPQRRILPARKCRSDEEGKFRAAQRGTLRAGGRPPAAVAGCARSIPGCAAARSRSSSTPPARKPSQPVSEQQNSRAAREGRERAPRGISAARACS